MLDHITRGLYYFGVHLLHASLVGFAAWVVTSIPRGSATTKYWIWVATTLNFILPLGAVLDKLGASHLSWATPLGVIGDLGARITHNVIAATVLSTVWLLSATLMFTRFCLRIRAEHRDTQAASGPSAHDRVHDNDKGGSFLAHGVPVRFTASRQAPAVDGVLRPPVVFAGVLRTVAHTACCWVVRT